ncbi:MAG: polysaccharide deacetylase family protein [Lachnospiraceae bacterium]
MKKAVRVLFCINLLVVTVLVFRVLTVKMVQIRQDRETVSTQSKNVKTLTEDTKKKRVALTFDDGPDPNYTEKLLDGLKERDVKATFFLLGKQVDQYPDIVKRMYKEGHIIGNHSYDHVNLATLSATDAKNQISKTNEAIYKITGEYPQYLRPPFGNEPQNEDVAKDMITVLWDVDPLDWCCGSSTNVANKVEKSVKEGDIILLHDASKSSVEAALQIVDELTEKGYEFVTVDKLIFE